MIIILYITAVDRPGVQSGPETKQVKPWKMKFPVRYTNFLLPPIHNWKRYPTLIPSRLSPFALRLRPLSIPTVRRCSAFVAGLLACVCCAFSYPGRWHGISLSALHIALQRRFSVSWFCYHVITCVSLGWSIGTDTWCAGCRRVEWTVYREEHNHTHTARQFSSKFSYSYCCTYVSHVFFRYHRHSIVAGMVWCLSLASHLLPRKIVFTRPYVGCKQGGIVWSIAVSDFDDPA